MKTSQGFRRKPYKVRRKKSALKVILSVLKSRLFGAGFLVFIFIGMSVYFFIFSQFFQIKHITLTGQERVAEQDIKNVVEDGLERKFLFFPTKSIFLFNCKEIRKNLLDDFPQLVEVRINRKFPDALNVVITERQRRAVWHWEEQRFFLDNNGVIFEQVFDFAADALEIKSLPLFGEPKIGQMVVGKEELSKVFEIESKLKSLEIPIEIIEIVSEQRVNAKIKEGWEIYFNIQEDIVWQATELETLLKEKILPENRKDLEYIDLRFDKIFYK
ncbi:FtsQ-type POTRA domain-containing protein [Candidatus Parcubacteria bacterium]|nr:FtsQ-type POTRA domain-containing protein [Candidatus Parcubacteria bacterium]